MVGNMVPYSRNLAVQQGSEYTVVGNHPSQNHTPIF